MEGCIQISTNIYLGRKLVMNDLEFCVLESCFRLEGYSGLDLLQILATIGFIVIGVVYIKNTKSRDDKIDKTYNILNGENLPEGKKSNFEELTDNIKEVKGSVKEIDKKVDRNSEKISKLEGNVEVILDKRKK